MGIENLQHPMEPQKTTSLLGCPIDHQGAEHSGREVDLDRRTGARLCFAHATVLYVNTEFASISPWIKSAWDMAHSLLIQKWHNLRIQTNLVPAIFREEQGGEHAENNNVG